MTLHPKSRSTKVKRSAETITAVSTISVDKDRDYRRYSGLLKLEMFTFLAIKLQIFTAQKVIAYHWKGNQLTYVMRIIDHRPLKISSTKMAKTKFWKNLLPVILLTSRYFKIRAFRNVGI